MMERYLLDVSLVAALIEGLRKYLHSILTFCTAGICCRDRRGTVMSQTVHGISDISLLTTVTDSASKELNHA